MEIPEINLKVLHITKLYSPWVGGVERNVQELVEAIRDKVKAQVLCCEFRGKTKKEKINGVKVLRACSLGLLLSTPISPCFSFHFRELSKKVDLLHYHMLFPLAELMEIIANPQKKKIATLHYDRVKRNYLMKIYEPILHLFLKRMDKIIVPSKVFLESKLLNVFKKKVEVIPFGIDLRKFELNPQKEKLAKEIKQRYRFPIILFVGNLLPYKGLKYLIEAMERINGNLLIIGDGFLKNELKKLVAEKRVEEKVHFLGRKDYSELVSYYHACDIFVLPSLYESFGLVQLEAMACGKPVINTNISSAVPEISLHEETGLTVQPANSESLSEAIKRLIENKDEMIKYGLKARERVRKFYSIDVISKRIVRIYKELLI
ncbi:MAG: glycosyltransferase [Candidatus Aminicenantia bacterium]